MDAGAEEEMEARFTLRCEVDYYGHLHVPTVDGVTPKLREYGKWVARAIIDLYNTSRIPSTFGKATRDLADRQLEFTF